MISIESEIEKTARTDFNIPYVYPWQQLVIENILCSEKKSSRIVLLPTGAGKSLCFLIPSQILDGITIIVYPLLALIADQERRLLESGITPVVLRGGQTKEEREKIFFQLRNNETNIILTNPELLNQPNVLTLLKTFHISHFVIDEAHCVSEWGDSFRPAYLSLKNAVKELNADTVSAFTATASPHVLERINGLLFNHEAHVIRGSSDRENIHYSVIPVVVKEKKAAELLLTEEKPAIVFCSSRKRTENFAKFLYVFLDKKNIVRFYHAGLERDEKTEIEQWFSKKEDGILVTTCAYGMGVDKKNIRTVIHLDVPETIEAYVQEAGRAGRDGNACKAVLLWNPHDSRKFEKLSDNDRKKKLYDFAKAHEQKKPVCRRQILLDALGEAPADESGNRTSCSGCDVCEKKAVYAETDLEKAIWFLKKHNKYFIKKKFLEELKNELNKDFIEKYSKPVWEEKDTEYLFYELLISKKARICKNIFWRKRIELNTPTLLHRLLHFVLRLVHPLQEPEQEQQ